MNVVVASVELAPYFKKGGVGDVVAAMPKALRALGHKITLVVPKTRQFDAAGLLLARRLTPLHVDLGAGGTVSVTAYDGRLPSQLDVVLLEWEGAQAIDSLYDLHDDPTLAAVFSQAVVALVAQRAESGQPVDVLHLHDWPSALAAAYLQQRRPQEPALAGTKSVLTVHSFAHQGIFPAETFERLGLPTSAFSVDGFEFYGKVNLLKGGLLAADRVVTVSGGYARESSTPEGAHGLGGVVASLREPLVGIVNGVDYSVWNPATDSALAGRYDAEDASNKVWCKDAFYRKHFPGSDVSQPLVGFVGRLDPQKGVDVLLRALPTLVRSTDAQFVLIGSGRPDWLERARQLAEESFGRIVVLGETAEDEVHRAFAASDVVVMPSRFEPCGLVQLYAQRYGALPVVSRTGGLEDTVVDCDAQLETGTGFLFPAPSSPADAPTDAEIENLVGGVQRALAALSHPRYPALRRRLLRLDRSWERPARQYDRVFSKLLSAV